MVKSDAKKRLLVTDGDAADALLHGHEVVRGLVAVHLASSASSMERTRVSGSTDVAHDERLARVDPLVLAAVLRQMLAERNVDRGRRLGEEARIGHVGHDADDLAGLRLRDRVVARRARSRSGSPARADPRRENGDRRTSC